MKKNKTNPFAGIIFGIILIIGGTIFLWWNEGNTVANLKKVKDVSDNAISISSDKVDSKYEGKLITTNGDLVVDDEKVEDSMFYVGVKTPILRRVVEVYQWDEDEVNGDNNNKSYNYKKVWSSNIINSSNFHDPGHDNPSYMEYENQDFTASSVKVGAYSLTNDQLDLLSTDKTLSLDSSVMLPTGFTASGQYATNSSNLSSPEIGDVRISWKYNDYKEVSVLAVQQGNSFTDYVSSSGKTVNRVDEGLLTKDQIVKNMQDEDNTLKWIFRLIGVIAISIGYILVISPITTLTSYIPILGGIIGGALTFILLLVGFIHSLLVIAVAWIRFRPLLGICLLAVCVGLIFAIRVLIKKNSSKKELDNNNLIVNQNQAINNTNTNENNMINQDLILNNNSNMDNSNIDSLNNNSNMNNSNIDNLNNNSNMDNSNNNVL